jgi:hypothetical protein
MRFMSLYLGKRTATSLRGLSMVGTLPGKFKRGAPVTGSPEMTTARTLAAICW